MNEIPNVKFKGGDRVSTRDGVGKVVKVNGPTQNSIGRWFLTYTIKLDNEKKPRDFFASEVFATY
jgi:hypothetical protein